MADWGMGASSKKHSASPVKEAVKLYGPYTCDDCGYVYSTTTPYYGKYICPKCRKSEPRHAPSPPPASVQMTIEETFKSRGGTQG